MELSGHFTIPSKSDVIELVGNDGVSSIEVVLKRDDLINPVISGNKWRKLKYNLESFFESGMKRLMTVGGAYSNHLVATAYVCKWLDIPCLGLIKTHAIDHHNPSLKDCLSYGMDLIPVGHNFKLDQIDDWLKEGDYWLPEGGSNNLGLKGMRHVVEEIGDDQYDFGFVSVGSGGTLGGLIRNNLPVDRLFGVSSFAVDRMKREIEQNFDIDGNSYDLIDASDICKFGRYSNQLVDYCDTFYHRFGIVLDPIYTSKMMMTIQRLLDEGFIPNGATVWALHTGGIQGWKGMKHRFEGQQLPSFSY